MASPISLTSFSRRTPERAHKACFWILQRRLKPRHIHVKIRINPLLQELEARFFFLCRHTCVIFATGEITGWRVLRCSQASLKEAPRGPALSLAGGSFSEVSA